LPERLGGQSARVAVAIDHSDMTAAVRNFAAALLPYLLVLAVLLTAAAWAQVTIGLRPLAAVRRQLAAIASGEVQRLGDDFPDEVQPLARQIDTLLEARDHQIDKARARAADLAHGLKTPLQVLSDDAERLRAKGDDDLAAEIEDIAGAMRRHVDRELARARTGAGRASTSANVATVAQRVVRVVERTPHGKSLSWTTDVPKALTARIDPEDLTEALGNLAENAARHARSSVTIRARSEKDAVTVAVIDDGPGIPLERAQEALRRGGRLDSSGSAGLGLAIVGDIAEAWGATLTIETPERGCRISLQFPSTTTRAPA
jgi:signal transduction histidine kinase